jgi:hypothetical protein
MRSHRCTQRRHSQGEGELCPKSTQSHQSPHNSWGFLSLFLALAAVCSLLGQWYEDFLLLNKIEHSSGYPPVPGHPVLRSSALPPLH